MMDVIDGYLDERPVYLIRLDGDLPEFRGAVRAGGGARTSPTAPSGVSSGASRRGDG